MKKDAYYFPHFCNARHDRKIKRVIKELGVEGYGIFFMTLEVLREQTDLKYPIADIDLLADEFGTSEQKVMAVVANYGLFEIDATENFFSPKLIVFLQPYFNRKKKASNAASIRWGSNGNAQALLGQCASNASKVKKSKAKVTAEHKACASFLKDVSLLRRNRRITDKTISSWANSIRLMVDIDGVEVREIKKALEWYEKNWNGDYVPVIESARSLREKWPKLLNAIDRVKPKQDDEWGA